MFNECRFRKLLLLHCCIRFSVVQYCCIGWQTYFILSGSRQRNSYDGSLLKRKELEEFVHLLKSAKALPMESKPPKTSWLVQEKVREKIEALQAYAVDACADEQRKISRKCSISETSWLVHYLFFTIHNIVVKSSICLQSHSLLNVQKRET